MVDGSFKLLQDDIRPGNNGSGHAGKLRHMYAEAVFRPAAFELSEEDDLPINLLHAHIEVLDAGEALLHLVQLMVVRGKERAGMAAVAFVDVLDDSPRYGDAVIGACAASQFVEEHQTALR